MDMSFFQELYRRTKRASIWDPDAIPVLELKYAGLKRRLLPAVDAACIYTGVTAAIFGLPSIDLTYGGVAGRIGASLFALLGFLAFLGIAFPRLAVLEVLAKSGMIGSVCVYVGALIFAVHDGQSSGRLYLIGGAAIAVAVFDWRLSILRQERNERRRKPDVVDVEVREDR